MKIVDTVSTLPEEFKGPSSTAQILLSPDERHLYVSNRGHNSIAIFAVGEKGRFRRKATSLVKVVLLGIFLSTQQESGWRLSIEAATIW